MVLKTNRRTPEHFRTAKHVTIGTTEYLIAELGKAFDKVANPNDWKAAIYCKILASDFKITADAVWFYTATDLTITSAFHKDIDGRVLVHVKAAGYRHGPAGDH